MSNENAFRSLDVLLIDRTLARDIGLNEAIMFSEISRLINESTIVHENKKWAQVTIEDMYVKLPFFSHSTIGRLLKTLVETDLLQSSDWGKVPAMN